MKGLERFLGTVDNLEPQLMEATSGQAKYEHQHRAIVWRMPRLPKEGQGKNIEVQQESEDGSLGCTRSVVELVVDDIKSVDDSAAWWLGKVGFERVQDWLAKGTELYLSGMVSINKDGHPINWG